MQGDAVAEYTLRQIEYFVAVAETGSVTAGASAMHLSQSAMSTSLADLERALEVQLFVRQHARGLTLTPAGEQLLTASRQLIGQARELVAEARGLGSSVTGTLRLGCFAVLAPYVLPELLAACARRYPELDVQTRETDLAGLAEGILSGRLELGLGYDLAPDPRLSATRIFTLEPYVLVAAAHPLARWGRISLRQLAGEPMILLDLPRSRDYFLGMLAAADVEPNVRYRSSSVETVRALVGRGLGYTLLNLRPKVSTSLDGHELAALGIQDGGAALDAVILTAQGSRPTRRASAVAALCAEVLRPARRDPLS
jgi:DNA-binding transcriptional LysR family regulator